MGTYNKYVLGKIQRDKEGKEAFIYFEEPIEESEYGRINNVDISKIFIIRDLIVMYLSDLDGRYVLDPVINTFVPVEEEE
jgi:hypothetical protein